MIAFRRDLVVVDCQPPSKTVTKSSPTLAIRFPCRRTSEMPFSVVTDVFALVQLALPWIASHMFFSIFLKGLSFSEVVCLVCGQYRAKRGQSLSEISQFVDWTCSILPERIASRLAFSACCCWRIFSMTVCIRGEGFAEVRKMPSADR